MARQVGDQRARLRDPAFEGHRIQERLQRGPRRAHRARQVQRAGARVRTPFAADQGAHNEFHQVLYAGQPETEGTGWTDETLLGFGSIAGLKGADYDAFEQCVQDGTYLRWADNGTQAFRDNNIPGTPYVTLDGKQLPDEVMAGQPAEIAAWIKENAK